MIKAVIFDMDGTMVNTEVLWKDINRKLAEHYGKEFDESMRVYMMGRKEFDALTIFKEYYNLAVPVEELMVARKKMLLEDLSMVQVHKGLIEFLNLLNKLQIKKAVATSAFKEYTSRILTQLNLSKYFDVVITGNDVTHSKPNPEIFLTAAQKLEVDSKDCLVIEDAEIGVEAAYQGKMKVVAIPHAYSKHHNFTHATKVLHSFSEITEDLLATI